MWRGLLAFACWLLLYACLIVYATGCMPFAFPYHRYEGFAIYGGIGRTRGGTVSSDQLENRSASEDLTGGWDVGVQMNFTAVYRDEEDSDSDSE